MMRSSAASPFRALGYVGMLACLAVPACRRAQQDSSGDGANTVRGTWKAGQEWRLVPEVRIGSVDGDEAYTFSMVVGLVLDDLNRVWVADYQEQNIRVFDSRGAHVRTIGRKGSGPGEFRSVSGMVRMPDGNVVVLDFGNFRFSVFDTAGALVATHPRKTMISTAPWPGRFDSRGRLYDIAKMRPESSGEDALVRFDSTFQPVDTFPLPGFEEQTFEISRTQGTNRDVSRVNVPFAASQIWSIDPQGHVWIAVTDRYRVERHSFEGTADRVIEREFTPLPVTAADRRRVLGYNEDFIKKGGKIDVSRIPDTQPALHSFYFDDAGRLWVQPNRPAGEPPVLDVFEPTGRYLGQVQAPPRFAVGPGPVVRGDRMVAVTTDEEGVPTVVVFRIERPSR
jgi:hypothetical protein